MFWRRGWMCSHTCVMILWWSSRVMSFCFLFWSISSGVFPFLSLWGVSEVSEYQSAWSWCVMFVIVQMCKERSIFVTDDICWFFSCALCGIFVDFLWCFRGVLVVCVYWETKRQKSDCFLIWYRYHNKVQIKKDIIYIKIQDICWPPFFRWCDDWLHDDC